ncbi:cytochrome P450 [Lophiostoma macrostomum CBS 122681]|uniref:Cytochrome P450 n=1 Tax=Lophiostoma macrostomum CBS 122681 TaxID=1314788 RepID=A0A6A6TPH8_9PLEO|nr:cytochrome P450 [Lophiostoma macrostomum CBS 122681]
MLLERNRGNNTWTDDEMLGHLLNFMSAGHDIPQPNPTLVPTYPLSSACHSSPSSQDRIPSSQFPTAADLESLHYLDAFIKEVFRCFSPSVIIPRTTVRSGVTICNTDIPVGTTLLINPQTLHSNPMIWGPDVPSFNPDRHFPDHAWAKQFPRGRDAYAIKSFRNRLRICIGKLFALFEVKSVLVEVLRRFDVERGWDEEGQRLCNGEDLVGLEKRRICLRA